MRIQPTSYRNWIINTRQMFVTILDEFIMFRYTHVDVDAYFNGCTIMVIILSMQESKYKDS